MKSRRASCNATAAPLRWSKWPSKRSRAAEKEIGDDAAFQNGFDRIQAELDQIVESCGMQSRKYLGGLSRRDGEVSGPVSPESTQSAQIAVLLERIDALDEQVAELERARIDAELERARIDAELERARIEAGLEHALLSEACAEAQQRLAHARHRLSDMKKSMSWKLMKPARSAARLLTRRALRNNLKFPENHAHASSSNVRTVNRLNKRPLVSGQLYPPAPTPELQLPDAFVLRAVASHSEIAVVYTCASPPFGMR